MASLVEARRLVAPAKVNLALHVVRRREDGYHILDSLVTFAEDGDRLDIEPADAPVDELRLAGPFAEDVPAGPENLVLSALALARRVLEESGEALPPLRVTLEKRLPVASGIGGGSADAAAILRHVGTHRPHLRERLLAESLRLGADVPMCIVGRPSRVGGIGEDLADLPPLPAFSMLLVNPRIGVSTAEIFRRLAVRERSCLPEHGPEHLADLHAFSAYLGETRNDLEEPATAIAPAILDVRRALFEEGAAFARMSGSGASVFALFPNAAACAEARDRLAARQPDWWIMGAETSVPA